MPRLRRLSAQEVLRVLGSLGFEVVSIRGSHAKLVRTSTAGERQIVVVPLHRQLPVGTLQAIYRQVRRFIPDADLRPRFFGD